MDINLILVITTCNCQNALISPDFTTLEQRALKFHDFQEISCAGGNLTY